MARLGFDGSARTCPNKIAVLRDEDKVRDYPVFQRTPGICMTIASIAGPIEVKCGQSFKARKTAKWYPPWIA